MEKQHISTPIRQDDAMQTSTYYEIDSVSELPRFSTLGARIQENLASGDSHVLEIIA